MRISALLIALVAPVMAMAVGNSDRGGGTGIMLDGKLTLLDLVEADVHKNPYLPVLAPDPGILATLRESLKAPEEMKNEILLPLATKLTDIDQGAHPVGHYMAAAFSFYEFRLVPYKLAHVDDVDSAVGEEKIQLAERKSLVFYVNEPNWKLLDLDNKVALMIHEIVYAFQPLPHSDSDQTVNGILATSAKARYLTGYFFKSDWRKSWAKRLESEFAYGDGTMFNYLYGAMIRSQNSKTRVQRIKVGKEGELSHVFRALEVQANGERGFLLTRSTSAGERQHLCLRARSSYLDSQAGPNAFVSAYAADIGERLGRVELTTGGENAMPGHVTLWIGSGKVAQCQRELEKIQKRLQ